MDQALQTISQACHNFEDPKLRSQAEQILLAFRKSPNILPVCRYILEHTTTPSVQFHVASTIKEAVVREYGLMSREDVDDWKQFLLNYLVSRPILQYARETLAQALAVVVKRSWSDLSTTEREDIFRGCTEMLNGDTRSKLLSFSILHALLVEFSSEKSSAVGLTWDFHHRCKTSFEVQELRHIFELSLQVVKAAIASSEWWKSVPEGPDLIRRALAAIETCLSWKFENEQQTLAGSWQKSGQHEEYGPAEFPASWSEVLVRPDVIDVFMAAYEQWGDDADMVSRAEQCLISLAGLQGAVFPSTEAKNAFAQHFMHGLTKLIHQHIVTASEPDEDLDEELMGTKMIALSTIIKRFVSSVGPDTLTQFTDSLKFLEELGGFTALVLKGMAEEIEESWYDDAFDELLLAYSHILTTAREWTSQPHAQLFKQIASHVFDGCINARLQMCQYFLDEDFDEMGLPDYVTYSDQLLCVAAMGRLSPMSAMHRLHNLLTTRFHELQKYFENDTRDDVKISLCQEHIHWLILMSGFLLADSADGEKPLIPGTLMHCSIEQETKHSPDPIVALTSLIFSIADSLTMDPSNPASHDCSPMVADTLLWFLGRWTSSYLFVSSYDYPNNLSQSLVRAYGESQGGVAVLEFLLSIIRRNFLLWSADSDVLLQAITLLEVFPRTSRAVEEATLNSEHFKAMVAWVIDNLADLPEAVHSPIIRAVAANISNSPDAQVREFYMNRLAQTLDSEVRKVLQRPDFRKVYQTPEVVSSVETILEMFLGLATAANGGNSKVVFGFISNYLDSFVELFSVYHLVFEVQIQILIFFEALVGAQDFELLDAQDKMKLNMTVLELLKIYGKYNSGKRHAHAQESEEEAYEDVCLMLEILTGLMAGEYQCDDANVGEVVYFGVNTIIPLITPQMLQMPRLCRLYMHLISDLVEFFPEKLVVLPPELFENIVKSLEFGMENHILEVASTSLQALTALGVYARLHPQPSLAPTLDRLLHSTMDLLLFKDISSDLLDPAGEALLSLIMARHETYTTMITTLVSHQPEEYRERLTSSLHAFNAELEKSLQQVKPQLRKGLGMSGKAFQQYSRGLQRFLDVRGMLRVK